MMFRNPFKKTPKPKLTYLESYQRKKSYFIRVAPWDWLNKKEIYVTAKKNNQPQMITMDFWLQEIFLDANGQITVTELIDIACKQFESSKIAIPNKIDEYLIGELERLVNDMQIVEFCASKTELPYNIAQPMSKLLDNQ